MPAQRRKLATLILLVVCLGIGAVGLLCGVFFKPDPVAVQVDQLLDPSRTMQWDVAMDGFWSLGPAVIPSLAAKARQRDGAISKAYAFIWAKVPGGMQRVLPAPVDRAQLRAAAMRAISELGPLAARRAAREVISGMTDPDRVQFYALTAAGWLVPDSPKALAVFTRGLSDTNVPWQPFLNIGQSDNIWPRIPGIVPLLTKHLRHPHNAFHAAIHLGKIGSNAVSAIPPLIETLDQGVAGSFPDAETASSYLDPAAGIKSSANDKEMNHNRAMAAQALGKIGLATLEVTRALARAWNNSNAWVRANAAEAAAMLAPAMTNCLPELLAGLPDRDNRALAKKLIALGKIGPPARGGIETLERLLDPKRLRGELDEPDSSVVSFSPGDLTVGAQMAISRIDADRGRLFLPQIADKIGYWWDPVLCLKELRSLSNEVIRTVEPLLEARNASQQSIAAYVILSHNPQHSNARSVLQQNKTHGTLSERLLATRLLFESLEDTNKLCALIEEGFNSLEPHVGQSAAHLANMIGPAALPIVPVLKRALWHKDRFVRERAGQLLRKLAPEQLEPIQSK